MRGLAGLCTPVRAAAAARAVTKPLALCLARLFNRQTHHRGRIHAMPTAAGARPGGTDPFPMPDET